MKDKMAPPRKHSASDEGDHEYRDLGKGKAKTPKDMKKKRQKR